MRTNRRWVALAVAGGGMTAGMLAGCSGTPPGSVGSNCGTTRTGANVPVVIKVTKGTVNCATALSVENEYAALLKSGQIHGNGGGAPATVKGWVCQGYPTPEVLKTGNASECHTASAEVVAVIQLPSSGS